MPPASAAPQGLEFVGKKSSLLINAISDLRKFGLQHVVELPELVLVGDQSAGKSSLMSALTEVQLPKDQGICTKCPANIKTAPGDTWSCKVVLQQDYKYQQPRGKITVTQRSPFAPWVEQQSEVKEFNTIYDKSELEVNIKWAQIALLNHDEDYRLFIPGQGRRALGLGDYQKEREKAEAKFSPNVIAIEITGPELPALSFYDLPGIFTYAAKPEEQYVADVIRNLAIKYIKKPNALIIWTLAMKTDPSNSSTGKVIQDCKASSRTIGVLTNPDHLRARHIDYEKILNGTAHVVGHGYFVTKQPGEDANIEGPHYHALAREQEREFFNTGLWQGEWSQFQKRCGTTIIQEFLSIKLSEEILKSIPSIRQKVNAKTLQVDRDLASCPDLPSSDIRHTIMRLLSQFSADVKEIMSGSSNGSLDNMTLQSSWAKNADIFRDIIMYVKPMVTVAHDSDNQAPDVIDLLSDDEDDTASVGSKRSAPFPDARPTQRMRTESPSTPTHGPRMNGSMGPNGTNGHNGQNGRIIQTPTRGQTLKRDPGNFQPGSSHSMAAPPTPSIFRGSGYAERPTPFDKTPYGRRLAISGRGFTSLSDIRTEINNHTRPGQPGLINPQTYNELCLQAIQPWKQIYQVFLSQTFDLVKTELYRTLDKNIGRYSQTELFKQARIHLEMFLESHKTTLDKKLEEFWDLENYRAFTLNVKTMGANESSELQSLIDTRRKVRARAILNKQIRSGLRKKISPDVSDEDRAKEMDKRVKEIINKGEMGKDPCDLELRVAAYVRGYYMTAGMRFVDFVSLAMHSGFFRAISENVFFHLENELGIAAHDGMFDPILRLDQIKTDISPQANKFAES